MAKAKVQFNPTYAVELSEEEVNFLVGCLQNDLTQAETDKQYAIRKGIWMALNDSTNYHIEEP